MAEILPGRIDRPVFDEIIYQALRDCPVHSGPDRSYPCLHRLGEGELILAVGCTGAASLRPNDTWVQIDLDQWAPLILEGEPYLQRHGLEEKR